MADLATEKRLNCTLSVASGISGILSNQGTLHGVLSLSRSDNIDGGDFSWTDADSLDGGNFADYSSGDSYDANDDNTLQCLLSPVGNLNGTLSQPESMTAQLSVFIGERVYEDYHGDYEVTSFCADPLLTTSLILPTEDKHMLDDVTIYSVPTREDYNEAGGVTFTIGG